jgi:isopenicillin-N epimerase
MMHDTTMAPREENPVSAPDASVLREQFLIDPSVTFLNHGSFGACPIPVFDEYQRWQRELELQPVAFIQRREKELLDQARADLAAYLNTEADNLVYVPNATSGLNVVARSLPLETGDEILTTDHEYGALDLTWEWMCEKAGATYRKVPIPIPVTTHADFVERFWSEVSDRTRVIFLSHITSPTALIFPVEEICRRAREAGILTVIDGAHAPGHIPIDLQAIGADIYSGNCHKWLCGPKGSGFLWVRPEQQEWMESLTVSWGWQGDSTFVTRNQYQGTRDVAAYLAVPAAIRFQEEHDWAAVRERCHALALDARERISEAFGMEPITPDAPDEWIGQLVSCPIPPETDILKLKERLYEDYRIEIPLGDWHGTKWVRVSVQGYNSQQDIDRLVDALQTLVPQCLAAPTPAT